MSTVLVRVLNDHPGADWTERLRAAGYAVDVRPLRTPADLKAIGEDPPAAVAIDLSRAPTQGRDFGLGIRQQASSRRIPLVFVGGPPARVAQIRALLPGAVCTSDRDVVASVREAIARPPADAGRPASVLAGYSGTPLPRKLGIKPGMVVRLLNAPAGFEAALGELPEAARVTRRRGAACDLTLWFVPRRRDLEEGLAPRAIDATAGLSDTRGTDPGPRPSFRAVGWTRGGRRSSAGLRSGLVRERGHRQCPHVAVRELDQAVAPVREPQKLLVAPGPWGGRTARRRACRASCEVAVARLAIAILPSSHTMEARGLALHHS